MNEGRPRNGPLWTARGLSVDSLSSMGSGVYSLVLDGGGRRRFREVRAWRAVLSARKPPIPQGTNERQLAKAEGGRLPFQKIQPVSPGTRLKCSQVDLSPCWTPTGCSSPRGFSSNHSSTILPLEIR